MKRFGASTSNHGDGKEPRRNNNTYNPKDDENLHSAFSDIHMYIRAADMQNVKRMIKSGVKPCTGNGQNRHHLNCFSIAIKTRNWDILKELLKINPSGINSLGYQGRTMFMQLYSQRSDLQFIFELGADPHMCSTKQGNALTFLSKKCLRIETLDELLKLGVNPNVADQDGKTPIFHVLEFAGLYFESRIIERLLEAGANLSHRDKEGKTTLLIIAGMISYHREAWNIFQFLVNAGADPLAKDHQGNGALVHMLSGLKLYAFHYPENLLQALKFLYKAGCDLFESHRKKSSCPFKILFSRLVDVPVCFRADVALSHFYDIFDFMLQHGVKEESLHYLRTQIFTTVFSNLHCFANPLCLGVPHLCFEFTKHETNWFVKVLQRLMDLPLKDPNLIINFTDLQYTGMVKVNDFYYNLKTVNINQIYLNMVGALVNGTSALEHISIGLEILKNNGFTVRSSDPNVLTPVIALLQMWHTVRYSSEEERDAWISILKKLIDEGAEVSQTFLIFKNNELEALRQSLDLPICVWVAAATGNTDALRVLLPYWKEHPMCLVLFLTNSQCNPFCHIRDTTTWISVLQCCLKFEGPMPLGTKLYTDVSLVLDTLVTKYCFQEIFVELENFHSVVPSLKCLSRICIRKCVPSGNDLPKKLASLVPIGLKAYITMMQ